MSINHTKSSPLDVRTFPGYPLNAFCIPTDLQEDIESVIIPGGLLKNRIERLAFDIANDYLHEPFIAVCVLRGGFDFFTTLMKEIKKIYRILKPDSVTHQKDHLKIEFIHIRSYRNDQSTEITMQGIENLEIVRGQNVLVVEDIVDTGKSMQAFFEKLEQFKPKTARLASLTVKTKENCLSFEPHYVGFIVPDSFIIGANFDFNDCFRQLEHVCIIKDSAKARYAI